MERKSTLNWSNQILSHIFPVLLKKNADYGNKIGCPFSTIIKNLYFCTFLFSFYFRFSNSFVLFISFWFFFLYLSLFQLVAMATLQIFVDVFFFTSSNIYLYIFYFIILFFISIKDSKFLVNNNHWKMG